MTVEGCVTEVNELHVDAIVGHEDVLWLQVAVDQIGAFACD